MSLPAKLKAARAKANVTQAEADEICGLGKGTIASWESGRYTPHRYMETGVLAELAGRAAGAGVGRKRPASKRKKYNEKLTDSRRP